MSTEVAAPVTDVEGTTTQADKDAETVTKLQTTYKDNLKTLSDVKEEMNKIRERVVDAQDVVLKSFAELHAATEQFLVNHILSLQSKLKSFTETAKPRDDNVEDVTVTRV
jgi:uncharacterized phage infection (PIP) family protein YhgE